MRGFVFCNFIFVLQRESDIVQAFEQTVPREIINLKTGRETGIIAHGAFLKIDGQPIIRSCGSAPHDLGGFVFGQDHSEHAILDTVIGKDVCKGRRDHRAEAEIR